MSKKPITPEQKQWYLIGFAEALVVQLSDELKISKDQAYKFIIEGLEDKKN